MKKNIYKLDKVDCAACALKIEDHINKMEGVISSTFSFILLKFTVEFDENIIDDEEIEKHIHKSLRGVRILEKNNNEFIDDYEEENVFKKILFKGRRK